MSSEARQRKRRKSLGSAEITSPTRSASFPSPSTPSPAPITPLGGFHNSPPGPSGSQVYTVASGGRVPPVAIPRLPPVDTSLVEPARKRVGHACEPCRQQKAKCSGERPRCNRCAELNLECVYAAGKRVQHEREHERLKDQNSQMQSLLRDIRSKTTAKIQQKIQDCLDTLTLEDQTQGGISPRGAKRGTESDVTAEVGSQESVDIMVDDVDTDERALATGFLGKSSGVQWVHAARLQGLEGKGRTDAPEFYGPPGESLNASSARRSQRPVSEPISAATYHLDDQETLTDQAVDPLEMPTPEIAHTLFELFLENVNTEFPFIGDGSTAAKMIKTILAAATKGKDTSERRARAILNIIFAIGASYAHLVGNAQGDERDHFLYYTRARMLGLDGSTFGDHPTLQIVQITALTGFYYLCSSQISRAWMITGYAVRAIFALGLHMRNEHVEMAGTERETRLRLFWALWLLERQLVMLTGRPTSIVDDQCSVPQPAIHMFPDGRGSSSDQCLNFRISLTRICQNALETLYSPSVVAKSWASMQVSIHKVESDLAAWRSSVPSMLDFDDMENTQEELMRGCRTLGLHYHLVRILATRPCLCRLDLRLPNQAEESAVFNKVKARTCVRAAEDLIDLLPDTIDPIELYSHGPWYNQVNILMQTGAIFMLEMSFAGAHCREIAFLVRRIMKLAEWLREMARTNRASYRAWKHYTGLIVKLAPRVNADISGLDLTKPEEIDIPGRHHSVYPSRSPPRFAGTTLPTGMRAAPDRSDQPILREQLAISEQELEDPFAVGSAPHILGYGSYSPFDEGIWSHQDSSALDFGTTQVAMTGMEDTDLPLPFVDFSLEENPREMTESEQRQLQWGAEDDELEQR